MIKPLLILTSISGTLAVVAGAFGAHGLKNHIGEALLSAFKTGVYYQLFHTVALLAVIAFMQMQQMAPADMRLSSSHNPLKYTAILWLAGIALFSGSLYCLALGGPAWLGPITPIGGLLLIAGWLNIALSATRISTPSL